LGITVFHEFIATHREEIIRRCRAKVAARSIPPPTTEEIDHGVPVFLDQLREQLRLGLTESPEISRSAIRHGHDLLLRGFTVSQVVHDYGDVCQTITEMAVELNIPISTEDFGTLNRCLDDAIAGAVTEYGRGREEVSVDREATRGSERLGFFVHELRNLINTATLAFDVLKTGNVGVGGSTGTVLHRSLLGLNALVGKSLAELRLIEGIQSLQPFLVSDFVAELAPGATLEARARGIALTVMPIEEGLAVEADRQVLTAVVINLLQNAVKFTRPHSSVTLRVGASAEHVFIEVEDECGGLPDGNVAELFRPFERRGTDRTGLGLGLAFCRWAVAANHGRITARSLPTAGCIFTIELPRPRGFIAAPNGAATESDSTNVRVRASSESCTRDISSPPSRGADATVVGAGFPSDDGR
jgi:signal transduction histidine kinase